VPPDRATEDNTVATAAGAPCAPPTTKRAPVACACSQDAGWYGVGKPGGGRFRGFETLFTAFVPALLAAGLTEGDVRTLLVDNPRRAPGG
jgi:hypothetical protein